MAVDIGSKKYKKENSINDKLKLGALRTWVSVSLIPNSRVLAVKHSVGFPVDQVCNVSIECETPGLHLEGVAPRYPGLGGGGKVGGDHTGDLEHRVLVSVSVSTTTITISGLLQSVSY